MAGWNVRNWICLTRAIKGRSRWREGPRLVKRALHEFEQRRGSPRLLALCIILIMLSGCIYIEGDPRLLDCAFSDDPDCFEKIRGPSERDVIDDVELRAKLRARANKITAELEATYPLVPATSPLYVETNRLLGEMAALLDKYISPAHKNTVDSQMFASFDASDEELYQNVAALAMEDVRNVELRIIDSNTPAAQTFPNNRIYLTTGLVDPSSQYAPPSEDALAGVIAHELIHLYEQHIVEHWAVLESSGYQKAKIAIALLSYFSPVRVNVTRPAPDVHRLEKRIEYLADTGTVRLLRMAGRDSGFFLRYLSILKEFSVTNGDDPSLIDSLESRQACLRQCMAATNAMYRAFKTEMKRSRERSEVDKYGGLKESYTVTPYPTDEPEDKPTWLKPKYQYYLCVKASMELDELADARTLRNWLANPGSVPLEELSPNLTGQGRSFVDDMRHAFSGHDLQSDDFHIQKDIYRERMQGFFGGMKFNLTGDRLNILDGCPEELSK